MTPFEFLILSAYAFVTEIIENPYIFYVVITQQKGFPLFQTKRESFLCNSLIYCASRFLKPLGVSPVYFLKSCVK